MEDRESYHDRRSYLRTEGRKSRVHPYSRPEPRQDRQRQRSTFDLHVRDLNELMQCQTTAVFRRTNKRTIYNQHRMPKPGCRFAYYNFKRSVEDKEMYETRHSKPVVETSPNIIVLTGSSSANATESSSSLESENGNKSLAVIHKTQNTGAGIEPHDLIDLTVSDDSLPGTPSDKGMEAGTKDYETETGAKDHHLSTLKESDLISYFGDFDSVNDFDQNLLDSHTVGDVIVTTQDDAASTRGIVNHVPSQHLDVLADVEFSTSDVTELMPTQTQGPHLNPERNDSCVPHNAHMAVSTVSSDLMRLVCNDQLASSVSNLLFAHMPTWDMEKGCDSSSETALTITVDQYSILPPDCHPSDCEITEGTLSQSTSLTAQPAHSQLGLPQACVDAEHCSYPGSPLSSPSSVNRDLKEGCGSSRDVTLPAVSVDCSSPAGLPSAATQQHDSEFTPGVDNGNDTDHTGKHKAQLTILKQLISKVVAQTSQNAKPESLLKAVKYLKDRSKNFTTLWPTKGKIMSSVLSTSKLRHEKPGAPVQPQEESYHATNSMTRTQPNSARVRLKDAQSLPPQEDGKLKLIMTQQKDQGREQMNKAGQSQSCVGMDKSHDHKKEQHQPETGTQDPTHLEYAVDSDDLYKLAECTIDSFHDRRHLKSRRQYRERTRKHKKSHKSLHFAGNKQNVLSPVMTQKQQLDIGISSEQTHAVSSHTSIEPFSGKNNQLSVESLEIKEKSQVMSCGSSVTCNELSDKMSHVMVEPDPLVATNRDIMLEPTQFNSCSQAPSEKFHLRDPSVMASSKMLGAPTQEASRKCGWSPLVMTSHEILSEPFKATDSHVLLKSECNMDMLHEPASVTQHKIPVSFSEKIASKMPVASLSENTAINISATSRDVAGSVMPYALSQGVTCEDLPGHMENTVSKIVNSDETTISKKADRNVEINMCINNSMVGLIPYCELYLRVNSQHEPHRVTVLKSNSTSQGYTKDTEYHELEDTPVKDISEQATSNVLRKIDQLKMFAHFPQPDFSYGLSTSQNSSGIQIDALKLSTSGMSYESLMNNSTNDTVNVTKTLDAGDHNVSEFQKEDTLRSPNVKRKQSASNLITCCQEQPMSIPGDLIGAELSRIRKQMELAGQKKLSQKVNTNVHKPCRKCTVSSVKHISSKGISYSKNHNQKDFSKPANVPNSPEFYEGVRSLSETSALSGFAFRSHRRNQPCTKIPMYVSETTQFQPSLGDTSFHVASGDHSVADCSKPIEDYLFEDSHHPAGHQSQKAPFITRCLNTSQLHSPAGSAQLAAYKPPLQQFQQLDVAVSPCHDTESASSHVQTECLPDLSTLLDLSCNDMEVTDDCFHVGNSAPQHVETIRSHLTNEEHMMKAEVLLDCLIKEICHHVRRSSQKVVSGQQQHSEAEKCKNDLFSLQESSSYKSNTAEEYYHGGNCPPRKTMNVRSYSTCRQHTRKAQAFLDDSIEAMDHDASWSPLKVNKKRHTKSRKTKHGDYGMLNSSSDEDNIANNQFGESSLRKLKRARAHSENKYLRESKAPHNDPFEATFHDLTRSPLKMNKKKQHKKKSKHASYDMRKSSHDTDSATNDRYNHSGDREQSSHTRRSIRSRSASRTHFRKTTSLLDSPVDKSCSDTRWSPVKVHKKRAHGKKSKHYSCDTLKSIPDTDDHYRHHGKKLKHGSSDTLQSIHDTDDHYRHHGNCSPHARKNSRTYSAYRGQHFRKAKAFLDDSTEDTCHDMRWSPVKVDTRKHHQEKSKSCSWGILKSLPDIDMATDDHDYPDKSSHPAPEDVTSDSAQREHLRKAQALLDFPSSGTPGHDNRWLTLEVNPGKRYQKKSKKGSCGVLKSIPDAHIATHDHDHPGSCTPFPTHEQA